jgi:hypothetical protein
MSSPHADTIADQARDDHAAINLSFAEALDYWLTTPNCYINAGPRHLLMALDVPDQDHWHIHYAVSLDCCNPAALFIPMLPHWRTHITWARSVKGGQGRVTHRYRTDRLLRTGYPFPLPSD